MANNRIYTKAAIEAIKEGLTHYYPFELGLIPQRKIIDDVWTDSNKIFKWDGLAAFQKDLSDATKIDGFTGEKIKLASVTLEYLEHTAPEATVYKEADASPVTVNMPSKEVNEANQILANKARAQRESLKAKIHQETDAKIEKQELIRDLKAGKKVEQGKFPGQKIKQSVTSTITPLPKYFTGPTTISPKPDGQDVVGDSIFLGNLPKDELKRKADTENIIQEIRNAVERDQLVESIKKEEVPTSWTQPIQSQTTVTTTTSEPQEVVETFTQQSVPEYQTPKIEETKDEGLLPDQLFKQKVTVTEPEQQNESYRTTRNETPANELPSKQDYSEAEEDKTLIGIPAIPIVRDQPETKKVYSTQTATETLVDDRPSTNVVSQPLEKDLFGPQVVVTNESDTVSETSTPSLDEALATIETPVSAQVVTPEAETIAVEPKLEVENVLAPDLIKIKKEIPVHIPINDQGVQPIVESTDTYTKTVEPLPTTTEDNTSTISTKSKPIAEAFIAPIVNEQQTAVIIDSTAPYIRPNNVAPIVIDQEEPQIQPENTVNQSPKPYISIQTREPAYEETISESPNQIATPVSTQNTPIVSTTPVSTASTTSTSDQTYKEPDISNPVSTYTRPVAVVTDNTVSEPETPYIAPKTTFTQAQTYEQTQNENILNTAISETSENNTQPVQKYEEPTITSVPSTPLREPTKIATPLAPENTTANITPIHAESVEDVPSDFTNTTPNYITPIAATAAVISEPEDSYKPTKIIPRQAEVYEETHKENIQNTYNEGQETSIVDKVIPSEQLKTFSAPKSDEVAEQKNPIVSTTKTSEPAVESIPSDVTNSPSVYVAPVPTTAAVVPEPVEADTTPQIVVNQAQIYKNIHKEDSTPPVETTTVDTPATSYTAPLTATAAVISEPAKIATPENKITTQAQIYNETRTDNISTPNAINQTDNQFSSQNTTSSSKVYESPNVESTTTQTYVGPIAVSPPVEETKNQPISKEKIVTQSQIYKQTHKEVSTDQVPTDTITEAPVKNVETKTDTPPQTYTRVDSNPEYEESFTTQPVYISANGVVKESKEEELKESLTKKSSISEAEIEQMHVKERIIQIKESIKEKELDYSKKVEEAQMVQKTLSENSSNPQTDTKIYVKVTVPSTATSADIKDLQNQASASPQNFVADVSQEYQNSAVVKDLPNSEAKIMADQAALTTYETVNNNSPLMQAAVINKIVDSPEILDKVTKDAKSQTVIKEASANVVTQKLAEHENLKQFVDVGKIGGSLKLTDISVEISDSPQEGYEEFSLNKKLNDDVVSPHIQSFEQQGDTLDDFSRELSDRGIGKAKGVVLDKAGGVLSRKMASLPQDSLLARTYNHDLVQKVLLPRVGLGGVPSTWTAVEGNWLGNYLVASGYGDVAGYLQGATGWNLGVAEVVTIGSGVAMAGGFSYYTTTALAIEYSAGTFASEAFLGGAGVSMAGSTVGVVGTESIAGAVGTGLGAESFTGFAGYSAGTFASEAFYGGAVATTTVATGTTVAGTAAVGATGAEVGAATGAAVGGGVFSWATAAIGAAVGWLASKIDWAKVKSFLNNNKEVLLIGGLAVMGTMPALGITAILASVAAALSLGGYSFGGFFFGVWAFLRTVGRFFFAPFKNIAIGFGILIVIVTIIMFIINNSAYVTPPGSDLTGMGYNEDGSLSTNTLPGGPGSGGGAFIENPYIGITKVAEPKGPFSNSALPLTVKYTVTIYAKSQPLTIISITDECSAYRRVGGQTGCPEPTITNIPTTISVGNPFTFTYSSWYNVIYADSIISNTVTVKATVPSTTSVQTASTGTSITIGNPPVGCLSIDGPWNAGYKTNLEKARATLIGKYGSYVSKVCSSFSKISLEYYPGGNGNYWGMNYSGSGGVGRIRFYPLGVKSESDALYTLAHELGHSLASGSKTAYIYSAYLSFPGIRNESPYCFYASTAQWNSGESMPEAIALRVIEPRCGSVQSKWPIHYNFLQKYVFN